MALVCELCGVSSQSIKNGAKVLEESTSACDLTLQWLKSQGNTSGLANDTQDDTDTWFPKIVGRSILHVFISLFTVYFGYTHRPHTLIQILYHPEVL
jgi:hypothetical protein